MTGKGLLQGWSYDRIGGPTRALNVVTREVFMAMRCIIGAMVTNRVENAASIQKVLTECGCYIKTRLGLHEASDNVCSSSGLILLEIIGGDSAFAEVEEKLKGIRGLQVQRMMFEG
jgi:hypothetical protein